MAIPADVWNLIAFIFENGHRPMPATKPIWHSRTQGQLRNSSRVPLCRGLRTFCDLAIVARLQPVAPPARDTVSTALGKPKPCRSRRGLGSWARPDRIMARLKPARQGWLLCADGTCSRRPIYPRTERGHADG
jgi:hypothetical protein